MTGFVDPAFKNITWTKPNFLVWRISKVPEENHEAKPLRKELIGNFYDEDSYIVFSSSPMKRPYNCQGKEPVLKMEIHIHFWLGSKLSEDEQRIATIKAIELDEVIEGAGSLHREMQGTESNRFLSYFKRGMVINNGEITKVLKSFYTPSAPRLYEISQRASTLILTEQSSPSWCLMSSKGVYCLETKTKLFIWVGKEAGTSKKFLPLKMKERESEKKFICLVDGEENDIDKEDLSDFEEHLKLNSKNLKENESSEDLTLIQTSSRKMTKLYKTVIEEYGNKIIHLKNGPLLQSDLTSGDICIIDHSMNGVWVWVSKKVSEEERSRAINIGVAYLKNKPKSEYSEASKVCVSRVVEEMEPPEFKLLFTSWSDTLPFNDQRYFAKRLGRAVNATFTANRLQATPALAADTQLLDFGTGKMKIVRVNGDCLEPLQPCQFGIFHTKFSYLVHYNYILHKKERKILYYWVGSRAPEQEKSSSIWRSLEEIEDLSDAFVHVRLDQNQETPHFCAIFQGKMIILTSDLRDASEENPPLGQSPLLLRVTGNDAVNTRSVEVEPRASSLNSYNVFILKAPDKSFVWCGSSSKGDEREMARQIATKWCTHFKVILEGCEEKLFWTHLGGQQPYISKVQPTAHDINVPPRLYKCSVNGGDLSVSEIINYTQSDLNSGDIIILDCWKEIFVWIGRDVPKKEASDYETMTRAYIHSDPCGRPISIPMIQVRQGDEPPIFTGFFPSWSDRLTQTYDENLMKKLFKRKDIPVPEDEVK